MTQKLSTWLTLALAALLAAGCGSSSTSGSHSTSTPAATTSKAPSSPTGSTPKTSTARRSSELRELAVKACRTRIQGEPALTTAEKRRLEKVCSKAAEGVSASREAAQQVCIEIIKHSAVPGSPDTAARKQALAACKNAK